MALTLNPATREIFIPQADLTFVSGDTYDLDTDQFRKDVMDLLASEAYIWLPDAYTHNGEVTIVGTTFARTLEFINGFNITFENLVYSVRLQGSNNNIFDVDNGILNPSGNVTVISNNSAGLIAGSLAQADVDLFFNNVMEDGETFEESQRLQRAAAAGIINQDASGVYQIRDKADLKNRIEGDDTANGGRDITATDST